MNYLQSILLGVIQGLTEFLPISSSGHLFIASQFFGFINNEVSTQAYVLYSILLHLATLCAVLVFSYKIIFQILQSCYKSIICVLQKKQGSQEDKENVYLFFMIIISTLATIPIGLFINNFFENVTKQIVMLGFLISIIFLLIPSIFFKTLSKNTQSTLTLQKKIGYMSVKKMLSIAIIIGLVQGFAVLPGISRSGSTIVIAIILSFSFVQATRYSFLLAIPAILGALVLKIKDFSNLSQSITFDIVLFGMIAAFLSGLIGLFFLFLLAKKQKLWYFAIYLILLEVVLLFNS